MKEQETELNRQPGGHISQNKHRHTVKHVTDVKKQIDQLVKDLVY